MCKNYLSLSALVGCFFYKEEICLYDCLLFVFTHSCMYTCKCTNWNYHQLTLFMSYCTHALCLIITYSLLFTIELRKVMQDVVKTKRKGEGFYKKNVKSR